MEIKETIADWQKSKFDNEILIKSNLMQNKMALEIIKLCEKRIDELEDDELVKKESQRDD